MSRGKRRRQRVSLPIAVLPGLDPEKTEHQKIAVDLISGIVLSAIVALLAAFLGQQNFGNDFKWITFRLIQRQLTPLPKSPVAVVDVSDLLRDNKTEVTPRKELLALIKVLASNNPAVIGIDIDFSPSIDPVTSKEQFLTSSDPGFFDACNNMKSESGNKIPVYLGVSRTEFLPPDQWLVLPEFKPLAASLLVPKLNTSAFNSLADQAAKKQHGEDAVEQARTMSAALARSYLIYHHRSETPKRHYLLERVTETDNRYIIDYSLLNRLMESKISYNDARNGRIATGSLLGQIVLVGDVDQASDRFNNPINLDTIAGVMVQAAAAATLVSPPLYQIAEPWGELADFLTAFFLVSIIALARLSLGEHFNEERLFLLLVVSAVALVLIFGLSVNRHRIVWDDFLLVASALALHPFAEKIWGWLLSWIQIPSKVQQK